MGQFNTSADQVFVNTANVDSYYKTTYVGVSGGPNVWWFVDDITESQTENIYSHGKGATNLSRSLSEGSHIYDSLWFPIYEFAPDTYERYTTNREVFVWGTDGMLPGFGTNSDHTIEYFWTPVYSVLGVDTNSVVVSTNVAPPTGPSPLTLMWDGSMTTNYDNSGTNITGTTTNFAAERSTLSLATSGTDTNLSALFCLTGSVIDPYSFWPVNMPMFGGWKLVGMVPDGAGRVFKVLQDGSTNDASVALESILTSTNYYYTYSVEAQRVGLVMEWKGSGTNDTNWSQAWPLYVLKGTTVNFRVITPGFVDVAWPANTPLWSGGGSSTTNTAFSVTFNTVSADTNGSWITATAGSVVSNQVVVYDFKILAKGEDVDFSTNHRTLYGVGEVVNFSVALDPQSLSNNFTPPISWTGVGTADWTGFDQSDESSFPVGSSTLSAGAQAEQFTVTATLSSGINAGSARTTNVSVIAPTNAILLGIKAIAEEPYHFVGVSTPVHEKWRQSCRSAGTYQILPTTVSFTKITTAEGVTNYVMVGGTNDVTGDVYHAGNDEWLAVGPRSVPLEPPHPQGLFSPVVHGVSEGGDLVFNVEALLDIFGHLGAVLGNGTFSPSPPKTNTLAIPFAYKFSSKEIDFCVVNYSDTLGPRGKVTISKGGLGPFTKEFSAETTTGD